MRADGEVVDEFVEGLFWLMLDHYQAQVVEMDLTLVQAQALKLLRAAPLATSQLAAALGISAPAVTQLTDRLLRKHLIERQAAKSDRRSVIISINDKGKGVIDESRKRRNEVVAYTLLRLGDDDRAEVIGALGKLAGVLGGRGPLQSVGSIAPGSRVDKVEGRTNDEPPEASKERIQATVSLQKRRMRIEWD
jgi:DNA-binding MarR family transcriptional regulator